jgi:exo-beta-1,3-glucanase (GH17 family)
LFSWITKEQIEARRKIIQPYAKWIRIFSSTLGNEQIPKIAKDLGFHTLVGAWIGKEIEMNEAEPDNVIRIAKEGHADIIAIENEVLLQKELPVETLISISKK